jgi:hypothetical protein
MSLSLFPGYAKRLPGITLALMLLSAGACAHETDNFYLPLEPEIADLGPFLEAVHTRAIEEGVRQVNSRIESALSLKDPVARAAHLAPCHTPEAIAAAVAGQFGDAPTEVPKIQHAINGAWARRTFAQKQVLHRDISMHLRGHFLLDPRALVMFSQAGTIKAFGVYFGTDKLLHFDHLGYAYCKRYQALLRDGLSPEEARRKVIKYYSEDAFLAEKHAFGTITTGVYSNGDLAANYLGFKFFLNLTQKVVLSGQERDPLVVRCGVFWRVNDYVRPPVRLVPCLHYRPLE